MDTTFLFVIAGFLVLFPLIFGGVVWLIAIIGGWKNLEQHYLSEVNAREVRGKHLNINRLDLGLFRQSYVNVISLIATDDGLFISQIFPFGWIHRPLMIPWEEFKGAEEKHRLLGRMVKLIIGDPKVEAMEIRLRDYEKLLPYLVEKSKENEP